MTAGVMTRKGGNVPGSHDATHVNRTVRCRLGDNSETLWRSGSRVPRRRALPSRDLLGRDTNNG